MTHLGKHIKLMNLLLAAVILESIALAGLLIWIGSAPDSAPDPPASEPEQQFPPEKQPPADELTAPEILNRSSIIAHGMGAIMDTKILNCMEGFREQYDKGVRVFEVDLRLTADQRVVLRHDWRAGWQEGISETAIPTLEEFRSKPLLEQYTPLSFQDLLLLMEEYPDICIVTDTKFIDAEVVTLQFEAMLQDARELGLSYLFNRIAIQVYNPLMFRVVDNIYPFPWYIYTLYMVGFAQTEEDFREKADFCTENGIMAITMGASLWSAEYAPLAEQYGLRIYTHTVNDPEQARALLASGVAGVYTDILTPDSL